MGKTYHYEWAAFTDNLCYGRQKIAQDKNKSWVQYLAARCNMGAYIIVKIRVYDKIK